MEMTGANFVGVNEICMWCYVRTPAHWENW